MAIGMLLLLMRIMMIIPDNMKKEKRWRERKNKMHMLLVKEIKSLKRKKDRSLTDSRDMKTEEDNQPESRTTKKNK